MERKSLSKRKRFEVFKRDDFTCQYCGRKPPQIILEVDHINPVSNDGNDDMINLITACFDCNRGKTNTLIDNKFTKENIKNINKELKEKKLQMKEYYKYQNEINDMIENDVTEISLLWHEYTNSYLTLKSQSSLRMFVEKLGYNGVLECLNITTARKHKEYMSFNDIDQMYKYFCGVCWNKIRGN